MKLKVLAGEQVSATDHADGKEDQRGSEIDP